MKKLKMTPYPGLILLCSSFEEFTRVYRRLSAEEYPHGATHGSTVKMESKVDYSSIFLIHYDSVSTLAHELSHAVLDLFDDIGINPVEACGEPFAYMLSHLLDAATSKPAPRKHQLQK